MALQRTVSHGHKTALILTVQCLTQDIDLAQQQTVSPNQNSRTLIPNTAPFSQTVEILVYQKKKKQYIHLTSYFHPRALRLVKCVHRSTNPLHHLLPSIMSIKSRLKTCTIPLLNKILHKLFIVPLMKICYGVHIYICFACNIIMF